MGQRRNPWITLAADCAGIKSAGRNRHRQTAQSTSAAQIRQAVATHRGRPTERRRTHDLEQAAIRRVSLAAGSAPMVRRRGTHLAGCRCAPRPPYGPPLNTRPGTSRNPQGVTRRRQCTDGSAVRHTTCGLSLRAEAALRGVAERRNEQAQRCSGQGRIGIAVTAFCGLPSMKRSLYTK